MSDATRKNFSDKVQENLTPESQKSFGQKAKEGVTDTLDKAQRDLQPDESKSGFQQLGDSISSGHDQGKAEAKGTGQSLSETAGEYVESAKKTLNDAAEYVSGALGGASEGAKSGANSSTK
ncbi:CYFA0S22e01288g1_1 [Cyberlindnera fabianii]|uniref:12 kDa heat shock protein n=1 Tax=Cyberlindnera fabianii TaxID=36022 RepID=A0A061BE94_CYBFA|nr:12 kDa heat shock protein [Cyberlindnera fabianii]CDR46210.1 CYFA0S22e01288g1_1 [Cyberlindnera fabianii]